ncbi:PAAR domain-containing protein [Streptomyces sp. NPDC058612]|uniref:PAAR domain-containing protein n=1 Tax=Streptomyces sp. NPDC058612 TaxID=3346555 RepID=UPI0036544EDE
MPAAARVGDLHTCPMQTPAVPAPIPHVGGPVMPPGKPNVLIGNLPAAVVGSQCFCTPPGPPDMILAGSSSVLIGGLPAARQGDATAHGGTITVGLPTVMIGG